MFKNDIAKVNGKATISSSGGYAVQEQQVPQAKAKKSSRN